MTTNRDKTVNAATRAIGHAGGIDAVRALGDDRVVASARVAKNAYAAAHGHHLATIFTDIRAAQEAAGRAYVRHVEPLAKAMTPVAAQVDAAVREMSRSLGPVLQRLNEWAAAAAPLLEEFDRMAAAAAEALEPLRPALKRFHERKQTHDALDKVGWLPHPSVPYRLVEGCGDDLALLDARVADHYRARWTEIRDEMESGLAEYHVDDEARATFREALMAHDPDCTGVFCARCSPKSSGSSMLGTVQDR